MDNPIKKQIVAIVDCPPLLFISNGAPGRQMFLSPGYKFLLFSILVTCSYFLTGCEKAVNFSLQESEPRLVVEATIENDQPPVVVLSRSLNFFSGIDPRLLAESFVHDATVTISDGNRTQTLKEYSRSLLNGYSIYYYSIDSALLPDAFTGALNTSYSLRILSQGQEYTAVTTIPKLTKRIDSLWWKKAPGNSDSSQAVALIRLTDPPGFGDYIRYFTKRNRQPFYPALNSVFDDFVIDGTTYDLLIDPGVNRNANRSEEEHFLYKGDTLILKLSNIDKATFDFWRTMEYSYSSVGNPFSTPVKVLGNISNGALGYFGGYASQYRTLIIPK